MRFVLFVTPIESLNHFIGEIEYELIRLNYKTLIMDLTNFDSKKLLEFIEINDTAAICYDGFCALDKTICDTLGIRLINILMDHPMTFCKDEDLLPKRYALLMPDLYHVEFAKKYYNIQNSYFMPHMASVNVEFGGEQKDFSLFIPTGYRQSKTIYEDIKERFRATKLEKLFLGVLEYLLENVDTTLEMAMIVCCKDCRIELDDKLFKQLMSHAKLLDHYVRMYHRELAVKNLVANRIPFAITGASWKNLIEEPDFVTFLPNMNFAEVFSYMEKAQITLNIMPWFKAGSHDRIFNSLLHNSCPLSDGSSWLLENLKPDIECAYYNLSNIQSLSDKVTELIENSELQKSIVENGKQKVLNSFTTHNVVEQIIKIAYEL